MDPISPIRLNTSAIEAISGAGRTAASIGESSDITKAGSSFSDVLSDSVNSLVSAQREAEGKVNDLVVGRTDDVIGAMLAVNKASLSMTMALEVRNKLVDAYHEVMRMQV